MGGFTLRAVDVVAYARGCAALGSGGGGRVAPAALLLEDSLRARQVQVVDLADVSPDSQVAMVGAVGSPTVMLERLPGNDEFVGAVTAWEEHTGRRLDVVCVLEIGGVNGLLGMNAAARLGLPVLDADGMGRAFPRLDMTVVSGSVPAAPVVLAEARGGRLVLDGLDDIAVEDAVRRVLPSFGTWAAICLYGADAGRLSRLVPGSVSRALEIGRLLTTSAGAADGTSGLSVAEPFGGTVVQVLRPHDRPGVVTLESHADEGSSLRVDFLDEFVVASVDGRPIAWAPDVITLLDLRSGEEVMVDELRVGQRLQLLVLAAPAELVAQGARLGLAAYGLATVSGAAS